MAKWIMRKINANSKALQQYYRHGMQYYYGTIAVLLRGRYT